ncbi:hypothetical protein D3C77_673700 [compost metagenome]
MSIFAPPPFSVDFLRIFRKIYHLKRLLLLKTPLYKRNFPRYIGFYSLDGRGPSEPCTRELVQGHSPAPPSYQGCVLNRYPLTQRETGVSVQLGRYGLSNRTE